MAHKEYKIIVIDNDPTARHLITELLHGSNYKVFCIADPQKGLQTITKEQPDVIVFDLLEPEKIGFEFLKAVRKNDISKDIPIIIWTNKNLTANEAKILKGFAQAIVQKNTSDSNKILLDEIKKVM